MVSALDSGSDVPGSSPGQGTALCSWARHSTPIVPLSTQVYKWVPANLLLGVTLRWTSIPSRGEYEILLVASCYGNQDKLRPDGPLGSYADFTLPLCYWVCKYSGTPLYGHPLNTDTRILQTVSFVPTKISYIFSRINPPNTDTS